MSENRSRVRLRTCKLAGTLMVLSVVSWLLPAALPAASGPLDAPTSFEPRVPVAKCLTGPGLGSSQGNGQRWVRVGKGDTVYSRDLLVVLPGFQVDLAPTSEAVKLTLWGNLPGLSDSPVLESSVILHDTKAYDLDVTLVRGRIVLTNTKPKGAAKVWLRSEAGVQLILPEPGDAVAIEIYGRWPTGVPFSLKRKPGEGPVRLWEVFCLKGKLEIKADKTEWYMAAPPGPAYFHGNSIEGPAASGPEKRDKLPEWYDRKDTLKVAKLIQDVVREYEGKIKGRDPDEIETEILALADKEKNPLRARAMRYLVVHAMAAHDEIRKVAEVLGSSRHDEMRKAAVLALRHWIGAREGRDEKLYDVLKNELGYSPATAETLMQLLHSPFDPYLPETYETLIAYLNHRSQAVRELAHWHLVRLAPIGSEITYDASASAAEREKAIAAWKALIPKGELPKEKRDDTKKKG